MGSSKEDIEHKKHDERLLDFLDESTPDEPIIADEANDLLKQRTYARKRAESDFFYFARYVLGFDKSKIEFREEINGHEIKRQKIEEGPQWGISPLTPHKEMVDLLSGGQTKIHIEAPRGTYKSTLILCWAIWHIVRNPNVRVFYCMDTVKQSFKRVSKASHILRKNPRIKELWPDIEIKPSGTGAFTVVNRTDPTIVDPTMEAGGPDADFTGSHYDIMILDDIVNFKNVRTADSLANTVEFFDMVQPLGDPGHILASIGTRYHEQDLWSEILAQSSSFGGEWHCLVLDCGMELYRAEDRTWQLRGEPCFPFLDEKVLNGILHSKSQEGGHRLFSSQYLNKCLSSDEQLFFRENFIYTQAEQWMEGMNWYVMTDTAVTKNDKGCYSVVGLVGLDVMDHSYLAKLFVGRWKPTEFRDALFSMLEWAEGKNYKVRSVILEKTTANTVFETMFDEEAFRRKMRINYEKVSRGNTDQGKDQRIMGLEARMQQGRFHVLDTVDYWFQDISRTKVLFDPYGYTESGAPKPSGELVEQFIKFPSSRWKDIPDALADIEFKNKDGRRICRGRGQKSDMRTQFADRVGQVVHMPKTLSTPPRSDNRFGSKSARAEQIQAHGGRYRR